MMFDACLSESHVREVGSLRLIGSRAFPIELVHPSVDGATSINQPPISLSNPHASLVSTQNR